MEMVLPLYTFRPRHHLSVSLKSHRVKLAPRVTAVTAFRVLAGAGSNRGFPECLGRVF